MQFIVVFGKYVIHMYVDYALPYSAYTHNMVLMIMMII